MNKSRFRWFFGALASPLLFASVLLAGFSPFPISVAIFQYGVLAGVATFALNSICIILLYSNSQTGSSYGYAMALMFLVIAGPVGLTLGFGFLKKWSPGKSILLSTVFGLLGAGILLNISAGMANKPMMLFIEDKSHQGLNYFREVYEKQVKENQVTPETQNQFNKFFEEYDKNPAKVISALKRDILPNLVYIFGLLAWLNGILMVGFCKRVPGYNPTWGWDYLIRWKSPEKLIWLTISVITLWVFEFEPFYGFSESVLKILIFIYFLHGISVIGYLFHHYKVVGPFRIMGYLTVILFGKLMVAGLGLFDLWWDIRQKLEISQKGDNDESDIA